MKTMEEYHAELDRRVESKRIGLEKRRRAARAALAGLAACLCLIGIWLALKPGGSASTEMIPGVTIELPRDRADKFMGKRAYCFGGDVDSSPDIFAFYGLFAFEKREEIMFSAANRSPLFSLKNGSVSALPGFFPEASGWGAAYLEGGVYMPASKEVVCGSEHGHGICRYDVETQETECVVFTRDTVSSIIALGDKLIYSADNEKKSAIKLCDLSNGSILKLAEFTYSTPENGYPEEAKLALVDNGVAVLYDKKVYMIAFTGEVETVAENAEAMAAGGDRIYVFRGVERLKLGSDEAPTFRLDAGSVEAFTAAGERLGESPVSEYALSCCMTRFQMTFTVHKGKLVGLTEGAAYLWDPVTGEAELLAEGLPEYAAAASLGERLLMAYELEYSSDGCHGNVCLINGDGSVTRGSF